ncbi:MAG: DNA polymerase III subunit alpha, partial [Candidatus Margulisiibacteriota bacterium]
ADKCNFKIPTDKYFLPDYPVPEGETPESFLKKLCDQKISKRYPEITEDVRDRLRIELEVIDNMGFAAYFLIVQDFTTFARDEGIPVGPGRGSAAGSIVAFILGITDIDPLRYDLLFERFLNPERISMPDIDIDFCIRRRQEVIDYVSRKYGQERVAQIITFGTMAARAAIRDVGRVYNIPLIEVDRTAKLIPPTPGMTIEGALQVSEELRTHLRQNPHIQKLVEMAQKIEGLSRHAGTHAAGVVIAKDPLTNYVPLQQNEGQAVCQYPMGDLESIGLLKMDFLGLRNLTIIDDALKIIKYNQGTDLNLATIPMDDKKAFQLLQNGDTFGVFQLESRGMRELLKDLQPSVFEDIIALLALYRPGPLGSGMVKEFIENKHGRREVKYLLPELESILKETYGLILYQEQVMKIASVLGGFSLGQADMLRRAMGKKKKDVMDKQKELFMAGAKERNINEKKASQIFDLMAKFAEYGFNKSHSAAYAVISYQTAYLKANYPLEFMAALLTGVSSNTEKVSQYIIDVQRMGIKVLPPTLTKVCAILPRLKKLSALE